jgi:hypothetical protein
MEETFQSKMVITEEKIVALQNEHAALKQEKLEQDEEIERLQKRLAELEAGI